MSLFLTNPLMNRFWQEGIELQPLWFKLFGDLGVKFDYESEESEITSLSFEFLQLFHRYSGTNRFYHTPKHILNCLKEFKEVEDLTQSPLEVYLALWFHDIVYAPQLNNDVAKSADYAKKVLFNLGISPIKISKVERIILATGHKTSPKSIDEALAVDVDLAIFGKPHEIFEEYNAQIRNEYSWFQEQVYNSKRKQILENFLSRPQIYQTSHFRQKYEEMARTNLNNAILNLG